MGWKIYRALVSVMVDANQPQKVPDCPEKYLKHDSSDFLRMHEKLLCFRLHGWIAASLEVTF